jgi:hypothetical protein
MGAVINYYGAHEQAWKIKAEEPIWSHYGSADNYYAIDGLH